MTIYGKIILSSLLVISSSILNAQEDYSYVRIIIKDANSIAASAELDSFIRAQPGVLTSRMDRRTMCYLAIYNNQNDLSIEDFLEWITDLGYTPDCFVEGPYGNGNPVVSLKAEDCATSPNQLKN